ncbi:membrane protein implicated in regulation of membrane protease activity [Methanococcus voltae]|uniref:NfeD family protein n=1 Tax=Methanococcus voltae TaxID=2188 RepID=UPI001AE72C9E|nr:NfeD family protein [Methanococcus voltae]MBP2142975.1 membrane protein implicated in regulation of membrane protease activity [Methanococcus voltae]
MQSDLGYILIFIGLLIILMEAFTPGLYFPAAGIALIIYGLLLAVAPAYALPLAVVAGLLTVYIMYRFVYKSGMNIKIGAERLIGLEGDLVENIDENKPGYVIVNNEKWQAKTQDRSELKAGIKVIVTKIEGVSLIVEPSVGQEVEKVEKVEKAEKKDEENN